MRRNLPRPKTRLRFFTRCKKKRLNKAVRALIVCVLVFIAFLAVYYFAVYRTGSENTTAASSSSSSTAISEKSSEIRKTTVVTSSATRHQTTSQSTSAAPETTSVHTTESTSRPTTPVPTTRETTAAPKPQENQDDIVYTVRSGDNYYQILRNNGIEATPQNVERLVEYNGITTSTPLSIGETIRIPSDLK